MFIWFACMYGLGYVSQNYPSKLSFNFTAPGYLHLLCGRPLPNRMLDFSPTVLQVGGVVGALTFTLGMSGVLPRKLWAGVLFAIVFLAPIVYLTPLIWRGIKGGR
jgi:hypothetical protein